MIRVTCIFTYVVSLFIFFFILKSKNIFFQDDASFTYIFKRIKISVWASMYSLYHIIYEHDVSVHNQFIKRGVTYFVKIMLWCSLTFSMQDPQHYSNYHRGLDLVVNDKQNMSFLYLCIIASF